MNTTPRVRGCIEWGIAALATAAVLQPMAAEAAETGFEAAFRVGYGIPLGDATDADALNDVVSGQVPLGLDIGYRVIPNLFLGVYAQYGFAFPDGGFGDACESDLVDCSASDIRLGIEGHFHVKPGESIDPWFGLGFGYEWLAMMAEVSDNELSLTMSGFEFFDLQAGVDFAVAEHFYVGPFLTFTFAQFDSASADCSGSVFGAICGGADSFDRDIEDTGVHEWLLLGVRASFAP